jgi:hypothetical protein
MSAFSAVSRRTHSEAVSVAVGVPRPGLGGAVVEGLGDLQRRRVVVAAVDDDAPAAALVPAPHGHVVAVAELALGGAGLVRAEGVAEVLALGDLGVAGVPGQRAAAVGVVAVEGGARDGAGAEHDGLVGEVLEEGGLDPAVAGVVVEGALGLDEREDVGLGQLLGAADEGDRQQPGQERTHRGVHTASGAKKSRRR